MRKPKDEQLTQRGIFEKAPGSGVWWISYTAADHSYHREKCGTFTQAVKIRTLRTADALKGRKLPGLRERAVMFAELADDAITYIKERYARPEDDVARMEVLKAQFTGSANSIKPSQIKRVLNALTAQRKWAPGTRNHHHNLISLAYRWGIENEKVETNPARAVRRANVNDDRVRYLSQEEEARLRTVLRSNPAWSEHEPEIELALNTGLRRSSMYLNLLWKHVDLEARTLRIEHTKSGNPITLPLNSEALHALAIFRRRGDGTGRVVRNQAGETLNVNAHWFVPAVRAAGIANFRWHDLRHSFASRLRQKGIALDVIAELLGHSKKSGYAMTKRYAHLSISNLHDAVSQISNSTPTAPEPKTGNQEVAYVN